MNESTGEILEREQAFDAWELAYLRFETPVEERRKFARRLRAAGALAWPRDAVILDLFSGRGGGAQALRDLGFPRVLRLDLSPRLLRTQSAGFGAVVADCRQLPIARSSADVAMVHGGLHHLPRIAEDLPRTLTEVARVLKPGGLFMAVEPWRTPFLDFVHALCARTLARRAYPRLDALATMIEHERPTYETWLGSSREIVASLDRHFTRRHLRIRFGKLLYVGVRR